MTDLDTLLSQALALVNEDRRGELANLIEQIIQQARAADIEQARREALEDVCKLACKWCRAGRPATPASNNDWMHLSLTTNLDMWEWCQARHVRNLMTKTEAANG